jgi:mediator of RNA polymerase II transcription subunit 13
MHVAYQVSRCGKWVVAACCDQVGDAHDVRVWAVTSGEDESDGDIQIYPPNPTTTLINNVWEMAMEFANKASIEWRVVIAKVGMMEQEELSGQ